MQYECYRNGTAVFENLQHNDHFLTTAKALDYSPRVQLKHNIGKRSFEQLMREYIELRGQQTPLSVNLQLDNMLRNLEASNSNLSAYYSELGPERIQALSFREQRLQAELHFKLTNTLLRQQLAHAFPPGTQMCAKEWKQALKQFYKQHGIEKLPKMKDLETLYGFRLVKHHPMGADGKRYYIYELSPLPRIASDAPLSPSLHCGARE